MEPEGRLLQTKKLDNGLELHFYDQSRSIVGDRQQVQLLVHIPMEIQETYFAECENPRLAYESFSQAFAGKVSFQQTKVRNFIDNSQAEALLEQMKDDFLRSGMEYLSKTGFSRNYILQRYKGWEQQRAYRKAHEEAIQNAG